MTTEREEIELHPAVGELIVKMRADLATAIARADAAEFALQCEATRHEETRAAVREYFAAIDEERALDVAAVTMPARWPDAYARAVDQRDAADRWVRRGRGCALRRVLPVARVASVEPRSAARGGGAGEREGRAMTCITHHHACACREAAHADALRERDATIADLRAQVEVRDAAVREYLAAESALNAAHEERLNACHSPITSPDGLRATEDTHTDALLRRIAARAALRKIIEGPRG